MKFESLSARQESFTKLASRIVPRTYGDKSRSFLQLGLNLEDNTYAEGDSRYFNKVEVDSMHEFVRDVAQMTEQLNDYGSRMNQAVKKQGEWEQLVANAVEEDEDIDEDTPLFSINEVNQMLGLLQFDELTIKKPFNVDVEVTVTVRVVGYKAAEVDDAVAELEELIGEHLDFSDALDGLDLDYRLEVDSVSASPRGRHY